MRLPLLAIAVALLTGACGTPSAPTPAPAAQVTATIAPIPVPTSAESLGASLVRYKLTADVTFRAAAGAGARLTQLSITILNDRGTGTPQTLSIDLTVPSGGTARQPITHATDLPGGQAVSLQVSATGVDAAGKTVAVPAVLAPLTITAVNTTGLFNHVFVIAAENHRFENLIGSPDMPYLNGLASRYALATEYYANTHPSIGNYFMLTTGNVVTNNDNSSAIVTDDNIIRQLIAAGRTWKSYAEDLPYAGYTGGDTGLYARRHNVFALLSDVARSATQSANLVPFSQLGFDLAANTLPNYAFLVPNLCNIGHDCGLGVVDGWLRANIDPLISSAQFQRDGLLIITSDEADDADVRSGGGRVVWIAVSSRSRAGYRSSAFYQHQSTLRLTAQVLGLTAFPNQAATAPDMSEFFLF